jgi:hypothetical protein
LELVLDEIARKREGAAMRESVPHERVEIAGLERRAQRERSRSQTGNHLGTPPNKCSNPASRRSAKLAQWHPCVRAIMIAQIHRCLCDRSQTAISRYMAMCVELDHHNRNSSAAGAIQLKPPSYTTFCRHLRYARAEHFAVASRRRHNAAVLKADKV